MYTRGKATCDFGCSSEPYAFHFLNAKACPRCKGLSVVERFPFRFRKVFNQRLASVTKAGKHANPMLSEVSWDDCLPFRQTAENSVSVTTQAKVKPPPKQAPHKRRSSAYGSVLPAMSSSAPTSAAALTPTLEDVLEPDFQDNMLVDLPTSNEEIAAVVETIMDHPLENNGMMAMEFKNTVTSARPHPQIKAEEASMPQHAQIDPIQPRTYVAVPIYFY